MADQKQLDILKQGVDVWNSWKEETTIKINLREADLRGIDLGGAILQRADLNGANLDAVNLRGTILVDANLSRASLVQASFWGAFLVRANLSMANLTSTKVTATDLTGADLSQAHLSEAVFVRSDLRNVLLKNGVLGFTVFADCNLSGSIGLEEIRHRGPSFIYADTIYKSKGKIPIEFLRGCGLSDLDIEYAKLANPNLTEKEITDITYKIHDLRSSSLPVRYNSAFISYSFKDQVFAARLHDDLQNNGVRCWFAPHDIQGGHKIHEQIDAAIRTHDRLLLILSENSMNSEWVKTEIANARQKEIEEKRQVLFPISLIDYQKIRAWKNFDADTGKDSAREIREYFIPDFSNWQDPAAYMPSFQRLLQDLKA